MKKLLSVLLLALLFAGHFSTAAAVSNGEGLYPFTRRHDSSLEYGQFVTLRVLDDADRLPGNFGWLSWDGSESSAALAASLAPPGNVIETYFNPGTPDNGFTPNYSDHYIAVGKWVQGMPGNVAPEDITVWLDWHIANQTPMVIPLYDAVAGQGTNAFYRIASFAGFELESYSISGKDLELTGKFLRWVTNGNY